MAKAKANPLRRGIMVQAWDMMLVRFMYAEKINIRQFCLLEVLMKRLSLLLLTAFVSWLPGCATSENGLCLAGERDAIFDPALLGEWLVFYHPYTEDRSVPVRIYKVERDRPESKAYRITLIAKKPGDGAAADGKAYLTKLGDSHFADFVADFQVEGAHAQIHWIMKMEPGPGEVRLRPLSSKFIKRHPGSLRHVLKKGLPFEMIEVTASTQELIDFARRNARDDEAWLNPGFLLKRR